MPGTPVHPFRDVDHNTAMIAAIYARKSNSQEGAGAKNGGTCV